MPCDHLYTVMRKTQEDLETRIVTVSALGADNGEPRVNLIHANTSCKWFVCLTDVIPRCSCRCGQESKLYKPYAIDSRCTPVPGTLFPQTWLQDAQKRRSSPNRRNRRTNLRMPSRAGRFTGSVIRGGFGKSVTSSDRRGRELWLESRPRRSPAPRISRREFNSGRSSRAVLKSVSENRS